MKKLLVALFCLVTLHTATAQPVTSHETENLYWLAKLWGYLKYHHPDITGGKHNWDSVLVSAIPKVRQMSSRTQVAALMIDAAGDARGMLQPGIPDTLFTFTDFNWLYCFPEKQTRFLTGLKLLERKEEQRYVSNQNQYGRTDWALFDGDSAYQREKQITPELSLLGLFRYFNTVNYFYPYKNLIRANWDSVLMISIPDFAEVRHQDSLVKCMARLGALLSDGHAYIANTNFDNYFGNRTIPFRLRFIEGSFVILDAINDTLAKKTGILPGDVIVSKNGHPIMQVARAMTPFKAASNNAYLMQRVCQDLLSSHDSIMALEIQRGGKLQKLVVKTYQDFYPQKGHAVWKKLDNQTSYVVLHRLRKDTLKRFFKDIETTKTLIIDARGYPRFDVLFEFLSYVQKANRPFAQWTSPVIKRPGYFYQHQSTSSFYYVEPKANQYKGNIFILVDESCGSLGEYFPQALQWTAKAITIGSQTGGFDGNIVGTPIPGGGYLLFSGLGVAYPNGIPTQQTGLIINHEIRPTIAGISAGKDEVLEYALTLAKQAR